MVIFRDLLLISRPSYTFLKGETNNCRSVLPKKLDRHRQLRSLSSTEVKPLEGTRILVGVVRR